MKKTAFALSILLTGSVALADTLDCTIADSQGDHLLLGTDLVDAHLLGQKLCVGTGQDYRRVVAFSISTTKGALECGYSREDGKAELVKREVRASLDEGMAANCTYAL